ncbi:unnamed protein product [Pedinophyceae sp. YPF-701]|nr:unnamed protein product [Pedinophyceae sp. YPF-701]
MTASNDDGDAMPPPRPKPPASGSMVPPPPPTSKPAMLPPPAPAARVAAAEQTPSSRAGNDNTAASFTESDRRRHAVMSAASALAGSVAPAQLEVAAGEIVARHHSGAAPDAAAAPEGGAPSPWTPQFPEPDWLQAPRGVGYSLEVMRGGAVVEERPLGEDAVVVFGRSPGAHVVVQHPSCSRCHAVVAFAQDGRARVADCGSTHGTFLNKRRLKARTFAPLAVGDQLKLGQSTRIYILNGPVDLMPEEAPSRAQLRALQRAEAARERGVDVPASDAAAPHAHGCAHSHRLLVSFMSGEVDWRALEARGELTERQRGIVEKIRVREGKMRRLEEDRGRLQAKERGGEGLGRGQAEALLRCEQRVDAIREEIEDLEAVLEDSIHDSLSAKAGHKRKNLSPRKAARGAGSDEDDDDEFYDRTRERSSKRTRRDGHLSGSGAEGSGSGTGSPEAAEAETVNSLAGKQEALRAEIRRLEQEILVEESVVQDKAEEERREEQDPGADDLDAYMAHLETDVERDRLARMRKERAELEEQLARVEKMLNIADPDGEHRPRDGELQAEKAKQQARMHLEKMKQEQRRRDVATRAAQEAQAAAERTVREDAGRATDQAAAAPRAPAPAPPRVPSVVTAVTEPSVEDERASGGTLATEAAEAEAGGFVSRGALRALKAKGVSVAGGGGGRGARSGGEESPASGVDAALQAELALLRRGKVGVGDGAGEGAGWAAPKGQTGDGRTELNDRFGY